MELHLSPPVKETLKEDILHILLSLRGGMQPYVKTMTGETITFYVKLLDSRTLSNHSTQKVSLPLNLRGGMQNFMLTLEDMTITYENMSLKEYGRCRRISGLLYYPEQQLLVQVMVTDMQCALHPQSSTETLRIIWSEDCRGHQLIAHLTYHELLQIIRVMQFNLDNFRYPSSELTTKELILLGTATNKFHVIRPLHVRPPIFDVIRPLHIRPPILVQTLTDKTITVDNQPAIPRSTALTIWQRLIFTSKQFQDGHSSSGCYTQKESTLYLVLQLCGSIDISEKTLTGKTITLNVEALMLNPCIPT